MKRPKLIITCGLPASGKSTYLQTHHKDCVIVCLDEIRKIFYGHQWHQNAEGYVVADAKNIVRLLLAQGKSVVVDSTGLLYQFRKEWRKIGEEYGAKYTILYFDTPKVICLKNNRKRPEGKRIPDDVIERMNCQLQPPELFPDELLDIDVKVKTIKWVASKRKKS